MELDNGFNQAQRAYDNQEDPNGDVREEENEYLTAKDLIEMVYKVVNENWKYDNLNDLNRALLKNIVVHFKTCAECRDAFDIMKYEYMDLVDFEQILSQNPELSDWIC